MTSIASRSSVLALVPEVTEGTPVAPTGATQYTAMQDDFSISPQFDVLENAELRSSIGAAKPVLGAENPTFDMSHYLRGSGTMGTEPDYKMLPYAGFGAKSVASTEYDTAASSTTSILKVGAGEADTFERGEALLIQDGTNGYRIRCLDAASGTDLTLGFEVPTAPAAGVNLGKCVLYKPANESHPSFTAWNYLGNGGAIQMLAGCRVTELTFEATAGELVQMSASMEALEYFFNPIEITSATRYIDFTDDAGTFAAAVTAKMYKDPHELAAAIQTAMNDASTEDHVVVYLDASGSFKFTCPGSTVLSLLWNTGANTANSIASKIGFSTAADSTGAGGTTGYTGTALSFASPYTPTLDSADAVAAKNHEVMIGDADDYVCFDASAVQVSLSNSRRVTASICAVSGRSGSRITARQVTVSITAELQKYDVDKFRRFREGTSTKFQYSFGLKSGGNWLPGYCGAIYLPTLTITSFNIGDDDGVATLELEGTAFVNSTGQGEAYLGLL